MRQPKDVQNKFNILQPFVIKYFKPLKKKTDFRFFKTKIMKVVKNQTISIILSSELKQGFNKVWQ